MSSPNGPDFYDPAALVPVHVVEWPMYVRPTVYESEFGKDYGAVIQCGHCEAELYRFSVGSPETDLSELAHSVRQHARKCPGLTAGRS